MPKAIKGGGRRAKGGFWDGRERFHENTRKNGNKILGRLKGKGSGAFNKVGKRGRVKREEKGEAGALGTAAVLCQGTSQ